MRRALWWDFAVAAVCLAVAVPDAVANGLDPLRTSLLSLALAGFVLVYALLARPLLAGDAEEGPPWRRALCRGGLIALLLLAVAAAPFAATMQTVIYPLLWMLSRTRQTAIAWSTAAASAVTIGYAAHQGFSRAGWQLGLVTGALSLAFAVAMGLWISHVTEYGHENARLLDELRAAREKLTALDREQGAAAERERFARELHDTLAQTLAGLVLLAERVRRQSPAESDAAGTAALLEKHARDALGEARQLVARTAAVPAEPVLDAALTRLAERFQTESGVHIDVRTAGDLGTIGRESQVIVLRCVQEGLANVRKHAAAQRVLVVVSITPGGTLGVEITDDGTGFDRHATHTGFGLDGMRERLALADGELEVITDPGHGTTLRARFPLSPSIVNAEAGS